MRWRIGQLAAGVAAVWFVVASPVAHLDHHLLTAHMVQHLLLSLVAAPLVLIGTRSWLCLPRHPQPAFCWLAGSLTVVVWHVPGVFELALQARFWHTIEHASFFISGLLFGTR